MKKLPQLVPYALQKLLSIVQHLIFVIYLGISEIFRGHYIFCSYGIKAEVNFYVDFHFL
mgnify:CR=1 FL=1